MKYILLEDIFLEDSMEIVPAGMLVTIVEQVPRRFILNQGDEFADDKEVKISRFSDPERWPSYYLGTAEDGTSIFIPRISRMIPSKAEEIIGAVKELVDAGEDIVLTVRPGKKSTVSGLVAPSKQGQTGDKYLVTRIAGKPINKWVVSQGVGGHATGTPVKRGEDWLQPILDAAKDEPDIEIAKATLPDMFADTLTQDARYYVYKSKTGGGDDLVLLLSPMHKQGMYIVKNMLTIGSPESGEPKPFHRAINDFARQNPEAGRKELRQALRDAGEGIFFRRDFYTDELAKEIMTAIALDDFESAYQVLRQDPTTEAIIKAIIALREGRITEEHYILLT